MKERETEELPVFRSFSLGPVYRNDIDRTIGVLQIIQQEIGSDLTIEQVIQLLVGLQLKEKVLERRNKRKASIDSSSGRGNT